MFYRSFLDCREAQPMTQRNPEQKKLNHEKLEICVQQLEENTEQVTFANRALLRIENKPKLINYVIPRDLSWSLYIH